MSLNETLLEKKAERDALILRATGLLQSDERIVAAWLAGSLGRGDGDAFSDVDLWVVVRDAEMEAVREGRRRFVVLLSEPVLISEAPQNAPAGGAYLWALYSGKHGPQHVDWNWLPQSGAALPPDARLLFDKVGLPSAEVPKGQPTTGDDLAAALTQECAFFWAMCTVVAKYIARGKLYEVLNLLNIAGDAVSKVRWLLGTGTKMAYRDNAWDPGPPPFTQASQLSFLRTLASDMASMDSHIEAHGGQVPHRAIEEIYTLFDMVEQAES